MTTTNPSQRKNVLVKIKGAWDKMSIHQKMALTAGVLVISVVIIITGVASKVVNLVPTKISRDKEVKGLSGLLADSAGYILVKEGQEVHFPIKRVGENPETFLPEDFFEIIGVLGDPKDSTLSNFERKDIWLLLKCGGSSSSEKIFIFRLRTISEFFTGNWSSFEKENRQLLKIMFERGEFLKDGNPIAKTTGLFLYVELEPMNSGAEIRRLPGHLKVNCGKSKDCLYGETFNKKPEGEDRLVIGLLENDLFWWRGGFWGRLGNNRLCRYHVRIVTKDHIKQPRETGLLPDDG